MKLALGTAQFGQAYGVSNESGPTPPAEVGRILTLARDAGMDTVDTAPAYGDSEKALGRVGVRGWRIVSKIPGLPDGPVDGAGWVLEHIRQSLRDLNVDSMYAVLLHRPADLLGAHGNAVAAALMEAKEKGLVEKYGYSIYEPGDLSALWETLRPELVQAPLNVLDQRLIQQGWISRLHRHGIELHVRSVFLQGLLLMRPPERPPYFAKWAQTWDQWDFLVNSSCGDAASLCLGFVKAQSLINRIIVGVETTSQLESILKAWESCEPLDVSALASDDRYLIDPRLWPAREH